MRVSRRPYSTLFVLIIGSMQIVGYLTGIEPLRNLGRLTGASPLPFVFSHYRGLETFSPQFSVRTVNAEGVERNIAITPTRYGQLSGPYNRRNVYGAAFAFGAVLKEEGEQQLVQRILQYGLCPGGPLQILMKERVTAVAIAPKSALEPIVIPILCNGRQPR